MLGFHTLDFGIALYDLGAVRLVTWTTQNLEVILVDRVASINQSPDVINLRRPSRKLYERLTPRAPPVGLLDRFPPRLGPSWDVFATHLG